MPHPTLRTGWLRQPRTDAQPETVAPSARDPSFDWSGRQTADADPWNCISEGVASGTHSPRVKSCTKADTERQRDAEPRWREGTDAMMLGVCWVTAAGIHFRYRALYATRRTARAAAAIVRVPAIPPGRVRTGNPRCVSSRRGHGGFRPGDRCAWAANVHEKDITLQSRSNRPDSSRR